MGKVYCEVCKRRCRGNVLKANDKFFHKDCFKCSGNFTFITLICSECKCSLKAGGFFLKNDKYFCQKDYQKLSAPKCEVCSEVLSGDIVSALSYSFHKGCFICSQCKTPFNPGNRVTVWKDEFYCVCCSQSLSSRQAAVTASGGKGPISPLSLRQNHDNRQQPQSQQQPRLSFADYPSPVSFAEESMDSRITPPVQKTSGSILKSSLRQSRTMQSVSNAPNSRNSDFGGSVQLRMSLREMMWVKEAHPGVPACSSKNLSFKGGTVYTEALPFSLGSQPSLLPTISSLLTGTGIRMKRYHLTGFEFHYERQTVEDEFCCGQKKLHGSGRHPLSEYGRFYNLSYASIAEQPSRRLTDMYRRNALHTPATSNSISHLQHFHIPQACEIGAEFTNQRGIRDTPEDAMHRIEGTGRIGIAWRPDSPSKGATSGQKEQQLSSASPMWIHLWHLRTLWAHNASTMHQGAFCGLELLLKQELTHEVWLIPSAKIWWPLGNRFPLEPNRIVPGGMSRTSRSFNPSLRDALMAQPSSVGHLTTVLVTSPTNGVGGAEGVALSKRSTLVESEAASLEARRLASFPSGQPPDATLVPAIERYDWPAPASTAVMTAELMRERRQRLREQGVLQASSDESVEDLSIDTSVGSHCDLDRISGGIGRMSNLEIMNRDRISVPVLHSFVRGQAQLVDFCSHPGIYVKLTWLQRLLSYAALQAILLEEERVRRKKTRTAHLLDPVSASRSPNAKVEPPYKTRYATHSFASPSRESQRSSVSPHRLDYSLELVNLGNRVWTASDHHRYRRNGTASRNSTGLRPGYTAGQLSLSSAKTSSISGSHCFSSPRLNVSQANGHTNGKICEDAPIQSQTSPIRRNGHRVDDEATNLSQDFDTGLLGSAPSYSSVVSSTPYTMSTKHEGSPAKEIPYKELVASLGRPPKGIDRTRLEMYLSDSEFEKVFQLSRVAFYRLPEWKRNDLKRRVDLF
ncbi:Actin-binding LIM protein [Echinococcus granulosus]|uniref:Actin-binding LIM protein n=1 Tax=Echinococcus granulosus TaxID=6210 RepID=W6V7S3_ECHGR|nr:Actin-binding LIM protein [Echinococcus granulosus]EUB62524.1 Actin-binding LIM protein [Echinococcus granulosus]